MLLLSAFLNQNVSGRTGRAHGCWRHITKCKQATLQKSLKHNREASYLCLSMPKEALHSQHLPCRQVPRVSCKGMGVKNVSIDWNHLFLWCCCSEFSLDLPFPFPSWCMDKCRWKHMHNKEVNQTWLKWLYSFSTWQILCDGENLVWSWVVELRFKENISWGVPENACKKPTLNSLNPHCRRSEKASGEFPQWD